MSFFVAPIAGKLSTRLPVRLMIGVGLLFVGVGLLLMAPSTPTRTGRRCCPASCSPAWASGWSTRRSPRPPWASCRRSARGWAPGINSTFRQVGIATGIAGLGALFQALLANKATGALARVPAEVLATGSPRVAGPSPEAQHAYLTVFTSALNDLFIVGAVVAIAGGVLSAVLIRSSDFVVSPGAQRGSRARARGRAGALDGDPRRRADLARGERPLEHGLLGAARPEHVADAHAPPARLEAGHSASSGTRPWASTSVPTALRQRGDPAGEYVAQDDLARGRDDLGVMDEATPRRSRRPR